MKNWMIIQKTHPNFQKNKKRRDLKSFKMENLGEMSFYYFSAYKFENIDVVRIFVDISFGKIAK